MSELEEESDYVPPDETFSVSDDGLESETKKGGAKGKGRRKREIKYILEKNKRQISFSKRKAGIIKKAYQLSILTNTDMLLLIASETGHIYTFASPKFKPMVDENVGQELIQSCLNTHPHQSDMGDENPK